MNSSVSISFPLQIPPFLVICAERDANKSKNMHFVTAF